MLPRLAEVDADRGYAVRDEVEEDDEARENGHDVEVAPLLTSLVTKELLLTRGSCRYG